MKKKNTCYCRDAGQTMDRQSDSRHTDGHNRWCYRHHWYCL